MKLTQVWLRIGALAWMLLMVSSVHLAGQQIVSHSFEGLRRTSPKVLERLLEQVPGDSLNQVLLQDDVRRLSNFQGIVQASCRLDTLPTGVRLVYELREGITRYPIGLLGGLRDNFWWELGYEDQNWQGRGNRLTLSVRQTDGRLGGRVNYRHDYWRQHNWGFGLQLERYVSQEPLYFGSEQVDYRYNNHNLGLSWKYHFTPEEDLELGFSYFVEDYEKVNIEQAPGPGQQQDIKQLAKVVYRHRRWKYDLYQPNGTDLRLSAEFVFQKEVLPFYLLRAIVRKSRPSGVRGLAAGRLSLGYAANRNSPFAPFVLDSRVNVRGSGNRVDRGTAMVVLNLEYRYLLLQKPWLAIQGVVFSDVGSWRHPGGMIGDIWSRDNIKYFSGLGLRFISDKARQAVFRVDYGYGLSPLGRRGIVLGLGQYF